ncbi:hypothetical protein [Amycolatopsis speibonae]|uniref:Uncharacterized protein n=1 Tax=Amycolatopsis speibonae TaxID=1450224 RepID=A0ABV7NWW0_9PSEU
MDVTQFGQVATLAAEDGMFVWRQPIVAHQTPSTLRLSVRLVVDCPDGAALKTSGQTDATELQELMTLRSEPDSLLAVEAGVTPYDRFHDYEFSFSLPHDDQYPPSLEFDYHFRSIQLSNGHSETVRASR